MSSAASSYYKINRILLRCIGLWPYQNSCCRRVIMAVTSALLVSSVAFQLTTFATTEFELDFLLKVLAHCVPWLSYTLKYNVLCFNIKKLRALTERVRRDWDELSDTQEVEIIKKYSTVGKLITLLSASFIYLSIFSFIVIHLSTNLYLDLTMPANASYIREFPALLEYFVDHQKYYYPLLCHIFLVVVWGQTTMIATETLYMSYTQHACGLFQIASCRVEQALLGNIVHDVASSIEKRSIAWQGIISAINMHKKAIEFIEMSKANFSFAYLLVLPLGVLSLSVNLYRQDLLIFRFEYKPVACMSQLSRLLPIKEYREANVSFLLVLGHFWYMFFVNYLGQKVIDHSGHIFYKTYTAQWYAAPVKVQKLLWLVMQRSLRHCTIIVGGLFVPSLEGFATITSASISYFMVIYSVH